MPTTEDIMFEMLKLPSHIVIGGGFGDEGKGKVVSCLCSAYDKSLVARFCGGHQAGHHVMIKDGAEHVFANFGCGTLQNCPTYWSKNCTVDPIGILNEFDVLKEKGISPTLYIDQNCPVTTPFEKVWNKMRELELLHGSCGVGVGATIQREENNYSLLFKDIMLPSILKIKMNLLEKYYDLKINIDRFLHNCQQLSIMLPNIVMVDNIDHAIKLSSPDVLIFEGAQGLLLDQNYGFFPHVTRANTGSKNVLNMNYRPKVWLVTRAYQTRHGNGPMTNEHIAHEIKNNPYERNDWNKYQGIFRKSILDLDLLIYAINCDPYVKTSQINLVITCVDLLEEFSYTLYGKKEVSSSEKVFIERIKDILKVKNVFISRTPYHHELEEFV